MKAKHSDFEIPAGNPFKNDRLNRGLNAEALTNVIKNYQEGFTLAINGAWGTGKTTFIKMWKGYLEDKHGEEKGYKTIYFNAWENDLTNDPLVCILGELRPVINDTEDSLLKTLLKNLPSYFRCKVLSAAVDDFANNLKISKSIDAAKSLADNSIDVYKNELSAYENKKKGIIEFKSILQKLVDLQSPNMPFIFFIDELDRCRPDFAVKILEVIKHLFSVPGIVFVLSIDKEQLCNSIRGFYGSDKINTEEYLRRFIDIEYELPEPNNYAFCKYLYDYFEFKDFFNDENRLKHLEFKDDGELILNMATSIAENKKLTLRQIEKWFVRIRLSLLTYNVHSDITPGVILMLTFLKLFSTDLYDKIKSHVLSLQEIVDLLQVKFGNEIRVDKSDGSNRYLNFSLCELVFFYYKEALCQADNSRGGDPKEIREKFKNLKFQDGVLGTYQNPEELLVDFNRIDTFYNYKIGKIIEHIEITNSFKISIEDKRL